MLERSDGKRWWLVRGDLPVSFRLPGGLQSFLSNVASTLRGRDGLTVAGFERGTELGKGLYGLADLRAFVALDGSAKDGRHVHEWLRTALNPVGHHRWRPDYSFGDLISLFVVRELVRKGVRTHDIQEAEGYLREKWNTDRPFPSAEIKTDGRGVFVDDELIAGGQVEAAELRGQQVMREAVRERLTSVRFDDGTAAYWEPTTHVLVDPRIQFGEPVVKGTRVPTEAVMDMTDYATLSEIAADLAIPSAKVRAALNFQKRRLAALQN